ncbi:hypothetical protein DOT_4481 [Desulfosporosinus sp. OT]|nr:hypothetical protein DOT_4481 [Desulfosporosinus sp. OT]
MYYLESQGQLGSRLRKAARRIIRAKTVSSGASQVFFIPDNPWSALDGLR